MKPSYVYRARSLRVIDGDTFVAIVDLGFRASIQINVRLHGVNCPEHGNPGGKEATQFLADLIGGSKDLILSSYKDAMSFTRWVCDVWLPMDGTTVSDHIINAGYGKPFDPRKDHWSRGE